MGAQGLMHEKMIHNSGNLWKKNWKYLGWGRLSRLRGDLIRQKPNFCVILLYDLFVKRNVYSPFYKTLPKSSLRMYWISVMFYEIGDNISSGRPIRSGGIKALVVGSLGFFHAAFWGKKRIKKVIFLLSDH